MSNMSVQVEFLAGTSFEDAVKEAKEKAILWDLAYVVFDFNGIHVSVRPTANVDNVMETFGKAFGDSKSPKYLIF